MTALPAWLDFLQDEVAMNESTHEAADAAHIPEDHIGKAVIVKDPLGYALLVYCAYTGNSQKPTHG